MPRMHMTGIRSRAFYLSDATNSLSQVGLK